MTGWLSAAEEMDAYEGIWRGDADAFRAIAEPLQPTLRLVCLYIDSTNRADAAVLHTWESALRGLHMFRWHTPLATWIVKLTVGFGRTHETAHPAAAPPSASNSGPPQRVCNVFGIPRTTYQQRLHRATSDCTTRSRLSSARLDRAPTVRLRSRPSPDGSTSVRRTSLSRSTHACWRSSNAGRHDIR